MQLALVAMRTPHFEDSAGARRLDRIAHQLSAGGHDVTVYCAQWWDGHEDVRFVEDVRYRRVTLGPAPRSFGVRLPFHLARHRPDVVHARPAPPQHVVAASIGGTLGRAPVVAEWYGDEGLAPANGWTQRAATRPAAIVTPSELVRTRVREAGASTAATRIIPESIDFGAIEGIEPAEEVDVAFAHPLDERAGIQSLLLGLAELRRKDWRARIIGEGPERAAYEAEAEDLRIDDRVEFVGACDRDRRIAIYRGAHVFVQTAAREYFATELLWALACGCIGVVQYQSESSAHELIEGYERSYRVTDAQEIADAIADAGSFERRTVDPAWADYSHESVRRQYVDLYRELRS